MGANSLDRFHARLQEFRNQLPAEDYPAFDQLTTMLDQHYLLAIQHSHYDQPDLLAMLSLLVELDKMIARLVAKLDDISDILAAI